MTILTENTIEINCSISDVYDFVINMENFGKWFPEVIEIKSQNNLEHGVALPYLLELIDGAPASDSEKHRAFQAIQFVWMPRHF